MVRLREKARPHPKDCQSRAGRCLWSEAEGILGWGLALMGQKADWMSGTAVEATKEPCQRGLGLGLREAGHSGWPGRKALRADAEEGLG